MSGFATAASLRISRLYHYQGFNADWLATTLNQNTIFFSDPRTFNDPWDCKPWFNANITAANLDRNIQFYIEISRRNGFSEEVIQRTAGGFRANLPLFSAKIKELSGVMARAAGEQYRVYCLGAKPDSELMWAHYTNKHTGICLEFSTRNPTFAVALQVSYSTDYPIFDVTSSDAEHNLIPLIAKSASWAYEQEFRLISQERATATPHGTLISDHGVVEIPPDALVSIIVGCLATDATVAQIKSIIRNSGKRIRLHRIVRAYDRYKLFIRPDVV